MAGRSVRAVTTLDDLRALLTRTITVVSAVTDARSAWDTPWAHSRAGTELAAEEARRPAPDTGSWPWLLAPVIARWALQVALEEAKGLAAALDVTATSYAADALCRSVLETASLTWWLLDPAIGAQQRAARALVYRLHTARQTQRAVTALQLDPADDPSGYGETPAEVHKGIGELGWTATDGSVAFGADTEPWLHYTDRVAGLVERIWRQPRLPYAVLSAVAHGELLGLARNLSAPSPTAGPRPAPGPDTIVWLWHDTYLVLGALVFTADRAADFLALREHLAQLHELIRHLDDSLPALRPQASADPRTVG